MVDDDEGKRQQRVLEETVAGQHKGGAQRKALTALMEHQGNQKRLYQGQARSQRRQVDHNESLTNTGAFADAFCRDPM